MIAIKRRIVFELKKARERGHLLEGLAVALSNVDEIIALIKAAPTPPVAKEAIMTKVWRSKLIEEMLSRAMTDAGALRPDGLGEEFGLHAQGYRLSDAQAQAILELRLQRLTGLEQEKIVEEYKDVMDKIIDFLDLLATPERITSIITEELNAIKQQFGDKRRSEIVISTQDLSMEDLITPADVVVTLSHSGYIKSQLLDEYRAQKRGGRGKQATSTKEDDFIDNLFIANTHDYILCFSSLGRVYWIKVYSVPQGSRSSRGKPIVNLVQLEEGEKINAILPVKTFDEDRYIFMATSFGTVKKTPLSEFSRPRNNGIIAIGLNENDFLIGVALTEGKHDVMLFSDNGKAMRFSENDVRPMGRTARGVRGMKLRPGYKVISLLVAENEDLAVLTATENGYGKRTPISEYTRHNRGTQGMIAIKRRIVFELKKARERGHLLEGLAVALSNVDEIIALIKAAPTPPVAKEAIMTKVWRSKLIEEMLSRAMTDAGALRPDGLGEEFGLHAQDYRLSDAQAQAILELRLQRLTGLEQEKIVEEYKDVMDKIIDFLDILATPERITSIITEELNAIKQQFGDKRRSEIVISTQDLSMEDLITPADVVVTLSHSGYIKSQLLDEYRAQKRGGRGKQATSTKEDDFIDNLFIANTHDYILCFSSLGRVYWIKVYSVPQGSRSSRGKPIVNLVQLEEGEKINAILPVKTFDEDRYIFMATSFGTVKKTPLSEFSRPRNNGIIAIGLNENDFLIGVALTEGKHDVMLFSDNGKAMRFSENDVRPMGRTARGVRGMKLRPGYKVISLLVAENEDLAVLTATENGYGKRTPISEYTRHNRGTQGMIAIKRRIVFELKKARERGHLLEGLAVALSNVDEIIALIKAAPTPPVAKEAIMAKVWRSKLIEEMLSRAMTDAGALRPDGLGEEFGLHAQGYRLSDAQAQAILELRLQRLTGLEQEKIVEEYKDVMDKIIDFLDLLATPERITSIITEELNAIKQQFGDKRRSEIVISTQDLSMEDLITPADVVVTLSHSGYIKSQLLDEYRAQKRGGRGKQATSTKEDDFIDNLFIANTHDYILCFSSLGRVYWIKVYSVPQGSRSSRGKPIVNLVQLEEGEKSMRFYQLRHLMKTVISLWRLHLAQSKKHHYLNSRAHVIMASLQLA